MSNIKNHTLINHEYVNDDASMEEIHHLITEQIKSSTPSDLVKIEALKLIMITCGEITDAQIVQMLNLFTDEQRQNVLEDINISTYW